MRYVAPDGTQVDVITLSATGRGEDGQWLRVTGSYGEFRGMVRTPEELSTLGINVAELEEVK
jgi:hypothetical protein